MTAGKEKPLLIVGEKAPLWVVLLLVISLAPVVVIVVGPHPMPQWLFTATVLCITLPLIPIGCYVVYRAMRDTKDRESLLQGLDLSALKRDDREELNLSFTRHAAKNYIPKGSILKNAWRGEIDGVRTEFLDFRYYRGKAHGRVAFVSVRVASPIDTVCLKRIAPPPIRYFFAHRLKLGPIRIRKRWLVFGDRESARYLLENESVCAILNRLPKFPWFICIWDEDRLCLGFTGHPSQHGLAFLIREAQRLADAAHILETHRA